MADTRTPDQTRAPNMEMREQAMPQGQALAQQRVYETAVQRRNREARQVKEGFAEAARNYRHEIEAALKPWGVEFDFFIAGLGIGLDNTLKNDPDFFDKATHQSFLEQVIKAARVGLICDGVEAAIGRYGDQASFMPMIQGFVKVLDSTGKIKDINSGVVIKGDDFEFQEGDDGFIRHRPSLERDINGEIIGAWCIVTTLEGGRYAEVVGKIDLEKIARTSKAQGGPRKSWSSEMTRKAPFRRLYKRLPKTPRMELMVKFDNENYTTVPVAVPTARPVPTSALFSDRRHQAEEPQSAELDPRDKPEETVKDGQDEPPATQAHPTRPNGRSDEDVVQELRAMAEGSTDLSDLANNQLLIEQSADYLSLPDPIKEGFKRLFVQIMERLSAPPTLKAWTSSTQKEPKVYETGGEWAVDLLAKMGTIKEEKTLHAFWAKNEAFVRQAVEIDKTEAARVIAQAAARGLKLSEEGNQDDQA